ncbi:MAG: 50S ribosomal protein L10, partial [Candidatus Hodarchaeales archaeon]
RIERDYGKKATQINTLTSLAEQNSVIGLVDLSGISSKALQGIRRLLRAGGEVEATIKVAKNAIKTIAFENISSTSNKKDIQKIIPHISGSCAVLFSNTNPFKLQQFLNQNQVPAPAKTGQVSPVDVFVPEGTTNLDPGPIISELGSIGLQTRIEKGKIRITKTAKVLSVGDTVSESHSAVLSRLGIQPFKVGLKLSIVLENEDLIEGKILEIDEEKVIADLRQAYLKALALATSSDVVYYSDASTPILLKTAISQALSVAVESGYVTDKTIDLLVAKSSNEAEILKQKILEKDPTIQF